MQNEPESLISSDMPLSFTSFVSPSTTRRAPFIWQELPTQITTSVKPFHPAMKIMYSIYILSEKTYLLLNSQRKAQSALKAVERSSGKEEKPRGGDGGERERGAAALLVRQFRAPEADIIILPVNDECRKGD